MGILLWLIPAAIVYAFLRIALRLREGEHSIGGAVACAFLWPIVFILLMLYMIFGIGASIFNGDTSR